MEETLSMEGDNLNGGDYYKTIGIVRKSPNKCQSQVNNRPTSLA